MGSSARNGLQVQLNPHAKQWSDARHSSSTQHTVLTKDSFENNPVAPPPSSSTRVLGMFGTVAKSTVCFKILPGSYSHHNTMLCEFSCGPFPYNSWKSSTYPVDWAIESPPFETAPVIVNLRKLPAGTWPRGMVSVVQSLLPPLLS